MGRSKRNGGKGVDSRRNFDRTVGDDVPGGFLLALGGVLALIVASLVQWSCS